MRFCSLGPNGSKSSRVYLQHGACNARLSTAVAAEQLDARMMLSTLAWTARCDDAPHKKGYSSLTVKSRGCGEVQSRGRVTTRIQTQLHRCHTRPCPQAHWVTPRANRQRDSHPDPRSPGSRQTDVSAAHRRANAQDGRRMLPSVPHRGTRYGTLE
eukprot:201186-Rhodomonas_salina.1